MDASKGGDDSKDKEHREIKITSGSSNRGTPGPTSAQIKKLPNTGLAVEDFYTMMNRDTEKEILKQNKSP